jgi:hypothetical protein
MPVLYTVLAIVSFPVHKLTHPHVGITYDNKLIIMMIVVL